MLPPTARILRIDVFVVLATTFTLLQSSAAFQFHPSAYSYTPTYALNPNSHYFTKASSLSLSASADIGTGTGTDTGTQTINDDKNNSNNNRNNNPTVLLTSRFPTSIDDQIRQAATSISQARKQNITRHSIQLLLPLIGATELDDWPGGTNQMMEAASPLVQNMLKLMDPTSISVATSESTSSSSSSSSSSAASLDIQESIIEPNDGIRGIFSQATNPIDDTCVVLLPSADTVSTLQSLDDQVGPKRNFIVVNKQWRRQTDFGPPASNLFLFGRSNNNNRDDKIQFVQRFEPTFHCSNIMVEGNIVRILRTFPGPWRVYLRVLELDGGEEEKSIIVNDDNVDNVIDWIEIGTKNVLNDPPPDELEATENKQQERLSADYDGGKLFDYGIPSYKEIENMIVSREGYVPKSLSERASSAFTFIKDTL